MLPDSARKLPPRRVFLFYVQVSRGALRTVLEGFCPPIGPFLQPIKVWVGAWKVAY